MSTQRVAGRLAPESEFNRLVESPVALQAEAFAAFGGDLVAWTGMTDAERGVYVDLVLDAARKRAEV